MDSKGMACRWVEGGFWLRFSVELTRWMAQGQGRAGGARGHRTCQIIDSRAAEGASPPSCFTSVCVCVCVPWSLCARACVC